LKKPEGSLTGAWLSEWKENSSLKASVRFFFLNLSAKENMMVVLVLFTTLTYRLQLGIGVDQELWLLFATT
jgi:hypothetical protein